MSEQSEILFQQIYEDYYQKVISYIGARVGNSFTAEELASDVFFRCYQNIDRYDPEKAAVSTWIFTITNNILKNYYRDHKPTTSIDAMEGFEIPVEDDFDHAMRLEEIRSFLDEAFEQLDDMKRRILFMRYYDEMKTNEIAARLGMSESNVRVTLHRTLRRLHVKAADSEFLRVL